MKLTVLVENTCHREDLAAEHGLSLYVETAKHKLLFDAGATGLFAENARKLGVDLAAVDVAALSHGHYDHGGGLATFFEVNKQARLYLKETALQKHLSEKTAGTVNCGLNEMGLPRDRMVFTADKQVLDEELTLFSGVTGRRFWSDSNSNLYKEVDGQRLPDDFVHEQNMVITEGSRHVLLASCSHNGIANILDRYHEVMGGWPDVVIGGLHLLSPGTGRSVPEATVRELGAYLATLPCHFITGHCTGAEAFNTLKDVMGDQIEPLYTGGVWEL